MKQLLTAVAVLSASIAFAQTPPAMPAISNEYVTVWDLPADAIGNRADLNASDAVVVALAPESRHGSVAFVAKGGNVAAAVKNSGASRVRIISLKQQPPAPLPNTSGYPDAFPRPGTLKKVLENSKVTVWDYTFTPGQASPMHFHGKDTVTSFLKEGAVDSTTPDGMKTTNEYAAGSVRFSPRNRTHTERLVRGEERIIAVELK